MRGMRRMSLHNPGMSRTPAPAPARPSAPMDNRLPYVYRNTLQLWTHPLYEVSK
jgi:hypothetical protein